MLVIEILEGRNRALSKVIKEGTPEQKTFYEFETYLHQGGAFPVACRLPAKDASHTMAPGKYTLSPESYKVGQWGDLQIDRFNINLIPLPAQFDKKAG